MLIRDILRHVESNCQRDVDGRSSARLRWAMLHPENERKAFGARLATVRANAGYTLDSAAKALAQRGFAIGRGTIGAWETGRNVPDALTLRWLARLYQVPVDVLYSDAPVDLETIRLAVRLKAVVLTDSERKSTPPTEQQTPTRHTGTRELRDELFNLTSGGVDAPNKSRRAKKQGGSASTQRTSGPGRKGRD